MAVGNRKRVAVFVTGAFVRRDYLEAVSGHVQIALMAAQILSRAGHDVTLITTKGDGTDCLPDDVAEDVGVCVVPHATRSWPGHRVYLVKALRQVFCLRGLLKTRHFDAIHFFGGTATGLLLALLRWTGVRSKALYTPIKRPPAWRSRLRLGVVRFAFRRVQHVVPTADYVASGWTSLLERPCAPVARPGIMKKMAPPDDVPKNTVLFWRNATYENGVDIALQAFGRLAGTYPEVRFVFAVRPGERYEKNLVSLEREIDNVDVHIYPYGEGVSLDSLLRDARFVVQPFRSLSINPQMSIIETLYAGVPVIAPAIESNDEVVRHEVNGLLIPPDSVDALSEAIERLLGDAQLLATLARNARSHTEQKWNWASFGQDLLRTYHE
ncbi:MAG: glycosyltransferase family 4 protein [Phycisphaerales bacterium]|nr:MAG: glycosyltransferase family 4 protein [Phycisphaerales bacterium]